jgi:hypothetical protein
MVRDFSAVYDSVLRSLLIGDESLAARELGSVPSWQAPSDASYIPRSVPIPTQVKVFHRDRFTCRYCGRRTVLAPVLRLLSIALGGVFPYHPHGKMSQCHLAFWRDLASCDHLVPIARFGKSEESNLVTACYMCNSIKQNWTIEELGWELQPILQDDPWDGLSNRFPALLEACELRFPAARIPYFRNWLRALRTCIR